MFQDLKIQLLLCEKYLRAQGQEVCNLLSNCSYKYMYIFIHTHIIYVSIHTQRYLYVYIEIHVDNEKFKNGAKC